jgi:hypothetical protein
MDETPGHKNLSFGHRESLDDGMVQMTNFDDLDAYRCGMLLLLHDEDHHVDGKVFVLILGFHEIDEARAFHRSDPELFYLYCHGVAYLLATDLFPVRFYQVQS